MQYFFFYKQKTEYEMRISDWSSDVCSSDLYIANRSSGKQGHAIATALARHGAETTLVSGPSHLPDPSGLKTVHVETAQEMLAACRAALPVEVAICAAAVADWRVAAAAQHKLKTDNGQIGRAHV